MDSRNRWFFLLLLAVFAAFDLNASVLAQDGGVEVDNVPQGKLSDLKVTYQSDVESLQSELDDLGAKLKEGESCVRDKLEGESNNVQALNAWLPPWLANLPVRIQELAIVEWDEHGEPLVAFLVKEWGEHGEPFVNFLSKEWGEHGKPVLAFLSKEWGEHGEPVVAFLSKEWAEHGEPVVAFMSKEWAEHGEPVVAFVSKEWAEHGEPVATFVSGQLYEMSAALQETIQQKWLPAVTKQWENTKAFLGPHIETAKVRAGIEWDEHGRPVAQFASEKVSQISAVAQPYLELVRKTAQPYVKSTSNFYGPSFGKVHGVYHSLLQSTTTYHSELQNSLQSGISKYGTLAALATKKVIWFLASALLLLPVLGIFLVLSSTLGGKNSDKTSGKFASSRVGSSQKGKGSK